MADKLNIGATFPRMTINLVSGGTATLPDPAARYCSILFYRDHW